MAKMIKGRLAPQFVGQTRDMIINQEKKKSKFFWLRNINKIAFLNSQIFAF